MRQDAQEEPLVHAEGHEELDVVGQVQRVREPEVAPSSVSPVLLH